MDGNLPCSKHESEIKTLFKRVDDMDVKIEKIDSEKNFMYSLDKNMAVQTEMLKNIVEHNTRQDKRADKQDKRIDSQDAKSSEQHKVMVQMSTNLTELNEGYKGLKEEVKEVKDVQSTNEQKHLIHTGELFRDFIWKIAIPAGIAGTLLVQVIKYLK